MRSTHRAVDHVSFGDITTMSDAVANCANVIDT